MKPTYEQLEAEVAKIPKFIEAAKLDAFYAGRNTQYPWEKTFDGVINKLRDRIICIPNHPFELDETQNFIMDEFGLPRRVNHTK